MRSEFEKAYEPNPHKSPFTEVRFNEEKQIYEPLNPPLYCVARSLNAAWYGYRIRQTEVDELKLQVAEMKSRLNDAYTEGQSAMYAARQSKVDELQKRVDALTLALDQIAYPIPHMQKEAELNGCELNGYWAVKMSEDHTYSKDIARRALEKEQALKGGSDERYSFQTKWVAYLESLKSYVDEHYEENTDPDS